MSGTEGVIHIDVEGELQKIIQQLDRLPDQIAAPNILASALNTAGRKVRKQIVKDAKGVYAIKKKKVLTDTSQGAPKLFTASQSTMEAVIRSKGPMQDIMNFMTRPNKGTGAAAAKVLSSSSMKPLIKGDLKAFVTTFATGHVAIVQRDPPATYTSRYGAARRNLYGANADMTKIKKLLSPAVPHMLGNETVRDQAEVLAYETLQAEIQKRVERVLNKA